MAKSKLGRGLLSIITELNSEVGTPEQSTVREATQAVEGKASSVVEMELSLIDANPFQPRKSFDHEALQELAASIKSVGVLSPIIVAADSGRYTIIAGERRYRASKLAGLTRVPVIIKDLTLREQREIALIENLQREDLNPVEEAEAYATLIGEYSVTQEELAKVLGKSRPAITNSLRLLSLEEQVITMLREGRLTAGHARALAAVKDAAMQVELARIAVTKSMSVRELENFIKASLGKKTKPRQKEYYASPELKAMVRDMERVFDTKVRLTGNDSMGKLVIEYNSQNTLDHIYELIERLKKEEE